MLTDAHQTARRFVLVRQASGASPEPYRAMGGRGPASLSDPAHWTTLKDASVARRSPFFDRLGYAHGWQGIGYVADAGEEVADLQGEGLVIFRTPSPSTRRHAPNPLVAPSVPVFSITKPSGTPRTRKRTFIVRVELSSRLDAYCEAHRMQIKDALDEALEAYLSQQQRSPESVASPRASSVSLPPASDRRKVSHASDYYSIT